MNGAAPGNVPTELFAPSEGTTTGVKNEMEPRARTTLLRRADTADEIAGVTTFLLGPDAAYVTGHMLSADGGATNVNTVRPSGGARAWDVAAYDAEMYAGWRQGDQT